MWERSSVIGRSPRCPCRPPSRWCRGRGWWPSAGWARGGTPSRSPARQPGWRCVCRTLTHTHMHTHTHRHRHTHAHIHPQRRSVFNTHTHTQRRTVCKTHTHTHLCCCRRSTWCSGRRSSLCRSGRWRLSPGDREHTLTTTRDAQQVHNNRAVPLPGTRPSEGVGLVSHPALRPVELLEDGLKVLHRSICDQHDGLVTHAAPPTGPGLHTHTHTHTHSSY